MSGSPEDHRSAGCPPRTSAPTWPFDRKAPDWKERLTAALPDGIDRLFENAGGPMLEASIRLLNSHARIALCGLIDGYILPEQPARLASACC